MLYHIDCAWLLFVNAVYSISSFWGNRAALPFSCPFAVSCVAHILHTFSPFSQSSKFCGKEGNGAFNVS